MLKLLMTYIHIEEDVVYNIIQVTFSEHLIATIAIFCRLADDDRRQQWINVNLLETFAINFQWIITLQC